MTVDLFGTPDTPPIEPDIHTERSMLDRLNKRYGKTYRNGDYIGRQYVRAEHVPNIVGSSYKLRIADFITLDMFRVSRGERTPKECEERAWLDGNGSIHGHEVKVSRSDWLTELKDPSKAEAWSRHCHYFWLVAPKEIVRDDLPDDWGLLVPYRDTLRVLVQAKRRDPEPMPVTMIAALTRSVMQTETRIAQERSQS